MRIAFRNDSQFEKSAAAGVWHDRGVRYSPKRKQEALDLISARIENFNRSYRYSINRITIRNQRRRWGSCSRKGNLNFNYRIIRLPPALADYIVVHELCHLEEFNHSPRFWSLIAQTMPDFRACRRALRTITL